ncbi:FxDxF family PEP-CTERM protein [Sphingomonas qilianensis]|uniref:FxDxF family PEP-CTERM protein n=1 Tax=Sphingomonas qilianensis TaxID=1736690 RepID=A0ABU9XRS9_9SPHN
MFIRLVALVVAFAAMHVAPAKATVLVSGSGWQSDRIPVIGVPSQNSAWTFTIAAPSTLSITDLFIPGDAYSLNGDVVGQTSFYAGSSQAIQASGIYGSYWTDALYGKLSIWLTPGSYSFSVTGDGAGGAPADFGLRLDVAAVPEPAAWAMMTIGFGAIGGALRRRRRALYAAY